MIKNILLVSLCVSIVLCQPAHYRKIIVEDENAKCLDGSFGAYYISDAGRNSSKIMLFFEGGGWCGDQDLASTLESCYQRSKTDLGSTVKYPAEIDIWDGILSNDPANSFKDFTKIFIKYCDGSGHQGTKSSPIQYKDANLYFRGSNLTISKLNHLQKTLGLFTKASQVLVTGISAGGLAAFTWVDYIRNKTVSKNVYAVPDSGVFLDFPNFNSKKNQYKIWFMNLFKLSNTESNPPVPDCVAAYKTQPYMCMFAEHMHQHIQSPIFPVQSLYDSWSIKWILGINCFDAYDCQSLSKCSTQQKTYIQEYHRQTFRVLEQIGNKKQNGYWAPACVNHGYVWGHLYSADYNIPMLSNNTVNFALEGWVQKKPRSSHYMDTCQWPLNKPCSCQANLKLE